jgi:hypothetical protein
MMVFVTILGSIGYGVLTSNREVSNLIPYILAVFIIISSAAVIHPSPYILRGSGQVTEQQYRGYSVTYEHYDSEIPILQVRSEAYRYYHAEYGISSINQWTLYSGARGDGFIDPHFSNRSLTREFTEKRYLIVTESDRLKETEIYDGFKFSEGDFEYIEKESGIQKVITTGGYDLYIVN